MSSIPGVAYLKLVLSLLAFFYLCLAAFAAVFANKLVFPAPVPGYSDSPDIIRFPYNGEGESVSMIYLHSFSSRYLVFYHHGNGEDLQEILPRLQSLRNAGFSVLAWDYPGYGTSDGKPSEDLVQDVASQIWEAIPSQFGFRHENVVLYGRSLGSGPAIFLASRHTPAGLILEGAFTSTFRVGLGVNILPWDIFNNIDLIDSINCPVLLVHGTDDETVPFSHGQRLHELAPSPKFFTWIDGGRHSDLIDSYTDVYYSSLGRFVDYISSY